MNAAAHQPHEAHAYDSKFAEWAVLIGSMAGVLMQALDTAICNGRVLRGRLAPKSK